jgi:hypothetical protein
VDLHATGPITYVLDYVSFQIDILPGEETQFCVSIDFIFKISLDVTGFGTNIDASDIREPRL